MKLFNTLLVAGALAFSAGGAQASTLLFDFEDANNGDKSYSKQGFVFDPVNLNSSTRCAEDGPNPKKCFLEVKQGDPTVLSTGSIIEDEVVRTDGEFDLLGFYINFQGAGSVDDNVMVLTGDGDEYQELVVGQTYPDGTDNIFDDFIAIYRAVDIYDFGDAATAWDGAIEEQTGYFVVILDDYFDDIISFTWDASEGANNRVDCVAVSTGGTSLSLNDFASCAVAPPNPIPLPAAGWLLLAGLGGLAAMKRRKA